MQKKTPEAVKKKIEGWGVFQKKKCVKSVLNGWFTSHETSVETVSGALVINEWRKDQLAIVFGSRLGAGKVFGVLLAQQYLGDVGVEPGCPLRPDSDHSCWDVDNVVN